MKDKKSEGKKKEEDSEESKLEEEIKGSEKEAEEQIDEEINEKITRISTEFKAPVLEKINVFEKIVINLERDLKETGVAEDEEDDSFKYAGKKSKKEDPKYNEFKEGYNSNLRLEKENDLRKEFRREVGFSESPETRFSEDKKYEKYEPIKKFDIEQSRKEKDWERREIKYKPSH